MALYLLSLLGGLIFGSFANVCIYRLPRDESIRWPRSFCPQCKNTIAWWLNIPIVSYLAIRGRCFYCRKKISSQYPLIEAAMAALFLLNAWFVGALVAPLFLADLIGFYGLTISIIDYRHRIIPDELSISMLAIGVVTSFLNPLLGSTVAMRFIQSVVSCLAGGLLMGGLAWLGELAFKKEALGGGDIKFIAATGAVLGWRGVAGSLFIGSLSGGLMALALLLMHRKKLGETLPFGPFLCIGAYLACLRPDIITAIFGLSIAVP